MLHTLYHTLITFTHPQCQLTNVKHALLKEKWTRVKCEFIETLLFFIYYPPPSAPQFGIHAISPSYLSSYAY